METKVGLVGYGSWGKRHFETWTRIQGVSVTGIYDPKYKGPVFVDSIQDLLQNSDIVDVVVPAAHLAKIARTAIEAGKDVFIEKPVAVSYAEARELADFTHNSRDSLLMVGFIERFNPVFRKLKFITQFLQRPKRVFCQRSGTPTLVAQQTGVLKDLAIHDVDLLRWLLGEPTSVGVHSRGDFNFGELELAFDDIGALLISDCLGPKIRRWIVGFADKTVFVQAEETRWRLYSNSVEIPVSWRMPLQEELGYFLDCVRSRRTPTPSLDDAVKALSIIEQA
jgi:UDP-N-acetylglucosamine 3-dehydrogenase